MPYPYNSLETNLSQNNLFNKRSTGEIIIGKLSDSNQYDAEQINRLTDFFKNIDFNFSATTVKDAIAKCKYKLWEHQSNNFRIILDAFFATGCLTLAFLSYKFFLTAKPPEEYMNDEKYIREGKQLGMILLTYASGMLGLGIKLEVNHYLNYIELKNIENSLNGNNLSNDQFPTKKLSR